MINYLKNIKKETLIGLLPDIINSNNESIRKEFDWYFDSSLNRLKRSVYAPTGSVKAHFGEFVNLSCEYLTIKNEESIKNSIQSSVELVIAESFDPSTKQLTNHNILNNRFVDSQYEGTTEYVHDAASIIYEKENSKYITVKDILDNIDSSLDGVYEVVKRCDASIINIETNIQELNSTIDELNEDTEVISQSLETVNSSIIKLNNSINNLSGTITILEEINSNKLIYDDTYSDVYITKNQNNFITTPISDDEARIEIKFDDDINHEYNFKFILNSDVEKVYIYNDDWYNPNDDVTLYINCDNNTYYIEYDVDNSFIIRREDTTNSAMCDITLNRYINENTGTIVCMLYCKVYNLHVL